MHTLMTFCGLAMMILVAAELHAQDKPNPKTSFIDPEAAGPDFQIQGEYAGERAAWGAQVIARGDGRFDATLLPGGLPGAGGSSEKRLSLSGQTKEGATIFEANGDFDTARIEDGVFKLVGSDGKVWELKKVERKSPTLGAKPPTGALVLFSGKKGDLEHWVDGKITEDGLLGVGTRTKQSFGDYVLHLEFRSPFMPYATEQARGNSGMYLSDQYEVQILDSFGLEGKDNECGGIYQIAPPAVNMCLPPLSWQTYDVEFRGARFDDQGNKTDDAVVTIRHNGVAIHDGRKLPKNTPGGGRNDEKPGPLYLQDHGDAVHFRNIWVVEK